MERKSKKIKRINIYLYIEPFFWRRELGEPGEPGREKPERNEKERIEERKKGKRNLLEIGESRRTQENPGRTRENLGELGRTWGELRKNPGEPGKDEIGFLSNLGLLHHKEISFSNLDPPPLPHFPTSPLPHFPTSPNSPLPQIPPRKS